MTRPAPASGRARSGATISERNGRDVVLATARMAWSLRQLVRNGRTSAAPRPSANSAGNLVNVVALAPRQP
jgi:hypothetical protein